MLAAKLEKNTSKRMHGWMNRSIRGAIQPCSFRFCLDVPAEDCGKFHDDEIVSIDVIVDYMVVTDLLTRTSTQPLAKGIGDAQKNFENVQGEEREEGLQDQEHRAWAQAFIEGSGEGDRRPHRRSRLLRLNVAR
jgi:hypothetical protein